MCYQVDHSYRPAFIGQPELYAMQITYARDLSAVRGIDHGSDLMYVCSVSSSVNVDVSGRRPETVCWFHVRVLACCYVVR